MKRLADLVAADAEAITHWLAAFSECVRARAYQRAEALFRDDVVGFGSVVPHARGLLALQQEQWSAIWPKSRDFAFLLDELTVEISEDGSVAAIAAPWRSQGYHPDGTAFERPGRCTLLLTRAHRGETWRAAHTHFSLVPGVPSHTFEPTK